jgi:uncharacterized membrane protein (DUF4010 family)
MNLFAPASTDPSGNLVLDVALPASQFLPGLALALAIGFLIGVERGWTLRGEEPGGRVAGVRTFAILGLLGGLVGLEMGFALRILALLLAGGALAALLLGYAADMRRDNNVSATSTMAAIVTLGLGAMATAGHMALASVGAGALVILLAARETLHGALGSTSGTDIKALLRLVLVVFVILPLLPDVGMGPFEALNPQRLWMVVVVTGAISFVGYVLARWLGERRGSLVTAVVGALVSSTAVTVNSARRLREGAAGGAEDAAVAVASTMMLARALLLVSVLAPFVLAAFSSLVVPGLIVSIIFSAWLLWRGRNSESELAPGTLKPPGLGLAFLFAVSVAAISIASAWAEAEFGEESGALVIALGGTADIDAAIAAVGAMPADSLPPALVALALAAPVLFNTSFKLVLLIVIAGWRRALGGAAALALTVLALAVPLLFAFLGA